MGRYPGTATTGHDRTRRRCWIRGCQPHVLPAGQTIQQDLQDAVHNVFMHPNTGPFISKQLIQRMVTGNPSAGVRARVAQVFNNNGAGRPRRPEGGRARRSCSTARRAAPAKTDPTFGTLREPVLMLDRDDPCAVRRDRRRGARRPRTEPGPAAVLLADGVQLLPARRDDHRAASILAPEFGIYNSNSGGGADQPRLHDGLQRRSRRTRTSRTRSGTRLNIEQFEPLADNPAAMCDKINTVLMGGFAPRNGPRPR